jgi:hypothetical protein
MTAAEMVATLQSRGVVLVPTSDGRIHYRPKEALSSSERDALTRLRNAVHAELERDPVAWRVAAMATQLPSSGAIPLLLARPGVVMPMGSCCSCGDPLRPDQRHRCRPCVDAAVRVVARQSTRPIGTDERMT